MDIVVQHAELHLGPSRRGRWRIAADVTDDEGETIRRAIYMPADAIEWRVAQYNVDARAALEMLLAPSGTPEDEVAVLLAPTRSEARNHKLATVATALNGGSVRGAVGPPEWGPTPNAEVLVDSGDGDPIDTIIEYSPIDDDLIAAKREVLDEARSRFRRRHATKVAAKAEVEAESRARGGKAADPLSRLERLTPEQLKAKLLPTTFDRHGPARGGRHDG